MPAPANLIHETSTSTGTGNFTIAAVNGKQRFSTAFGTGATLNVFDYFISNRDAAEWERGTGHMSASATLVRDTVIESTNSNSAVNFSAGTKEVTNDVPAARQLRVEAQSLSTTEQEQVRVNLYAAPFDALACNGAQVNGSMEVSQEAGTMPITGITNVNRYVIDGWLLATAGAAVLTGEQSTDAPPGYNNSLKVTVTTADTSIGAADFTFIAQSIEGYRVARFAFGAASARPVAIGIWVKCSITGTFSASLRNSAGDRAYIRTFTVNAANTWEYKTLAFPGDTTGTWLKTSGVGIQFRISLGTGSDRQGTPNQWNASSTLATSGDTNFVGTTSRMFQIAGFIFLPGVELPSIDRVPLIMRPFNEENILCKRQYWTTNKSGNALPLFYGYNVGTATEHFFGVHPVPMRASPTGTVFGTWATSNCAQPVVSSADVTMWQVYVTVSGTGPYVTNPDSTDDYIQWDARL